MSHLNGLPGSFILTVVVGLIVYFLYITIRAVIQYERKRKLFDNLPGYKPEQKHWLRGHLHLYTTENGVSIEQVLFLVKRYPRYYRVWFGPFKPVIFLVHPETIKVLLKTAEPKSVDFGGGYKHLIPWIGEGLLVAGGTKRSRRLLTPAFHFEILKPYQEIYNQCADIFLGIIDKFADTGESFELFQLVSNCTLDIILQCAFSYHTNCQTERLHHPYCIAIADIARRIVKRNRSPLMYIDLLYNLSADGKKFRKDCDFVHDVADKVIESRRKALESKKEEKRKYLDFLDILLSTKDENGIGMAKTDIRAEVDTFMFEGHDTTTSGISCILYELAKNQHYQKACQDEIDKVMKDNVGFVTWDTLAKFEFLTQCIKEGMRVHPPVPQVSRLSSREITIDGTTFPTGTTFMLQIYGVHHNESVWKDHMKYDPERFAKHNDMKMDPFAFIPFAAGPRFTIELNPNYTVTEQMKVVLRAQKGIKCIAKRRK